MGVLCTCRQNSQGPKVTLPLNCCWACPLCLLFLARKWLFSEWERCSCHYGGGTWWRKGTTGQYLNLNLLLLSLFICGRCGGVMVSALDSRLSSPGSSPGRGHCVVFLGKILSRTLFSQCLSPPRSINAYWQIVRATWQIYWVLWWTSIPSRGVVITSNCSEDDRRSQNWKMTKQQHLQM